MQLSRSGQAAGSMIDGVAELLELGDQPAGVGFVVARGEPVGAEVAVGLVAFEHVVGGDQDRVRDRDLRPAHPAAPGEPGVLDGEVVLAVHPADRAGGLDEHRGQPLVAASPARPGLRLPADS